VKVSGVHKLNCFRKEPMTKLTCVIVAVVALSGLPNAAGEQLQPKAIVLPCSISPPPAIDVPGSGASSIIDVLQTNSCGSINVSSNAPWLSARFIVKATNNTVEVTVAPNRNPTPRTATLTFTPNSGSGFGTLTVNQSGNCPTTLDSTQVVVPYQGQTATVDMTLNSPNCNWSASANRRWVQLSPSSGNASTNVRYTVYPNFGTLQRSAAITIGDKDVTIIQPGNPRTANERLVQFFYFAAFGRLPSESDLAFQVSAFGSGLPRAQLFTNFYNSQEFQIGGRFVAGAYYGLLRRLPEYNGWLFQRNALSTNQITRETLIANFLNATEYVMLHGSKNAPDYVRQLYVDILKRQPGDEEVAFQVSALGTATIPERARLATNFLLSEEFRQTTARPFHSFLLPAAILGRDPGSAERGDIETMLSWKTFPEIVEHFLGSSEFTEALQ
jgi:hypothetical protein